MPILSGIYYQVHDVPVTIVNAEKVAEQHGLKINEIANVDESSYVSSVGVTLITDNSTNQVVSTISGNDARIIQVNEHIVDFSANQSSNMLIIKNNDEPGAIGEIGSMLGKLGININSMYVSPGVDSSAMMVVGIDRILDTKEVNEILKLKQFIHSVEQADIGVFN